MCMKRSILRINHSDTQGLSYSWCAYEFSIRIQLFLLDRESCAFSSSNLFCQKSVFTLNCKFLQALIHTEKTREPIINVYMVFHYITLYYMVFQMFSILLHAAKGILNRLISVVHFSSNSNSLFHKKAS